MVFMYEENIHKALSSYSRREILLFLGTGKKILTEIAEHISRTPQTVDFHLAILEKNGLIKTCAEDGKKYYVLADKSILKFVGPGPLPPRHHKHRMKLFWKLKQS